LEFFCEQDGALRLARGAEISRLAGKSKQMLVLARRTADPGEASMKSAAIQKGFYGRANHGAQRTRLGLISLLVSVDIIVEVLFEQLIKGGSLGVSGTVEGRIATLPLSDGGRKRKSAHGSCRRNP